MSGRGGSGSFGSGRTAGYAIGEGRTSPWLEAIAGIRQRPYPRLGSKPVPAPRTRYEVRDMSPSGSHRRDRLKHPLPSASKCVRGIVCAGQSESGSLGVSTSGSGYLMSLLQQNMSCACGLEFLGWGHSILDLGACVWPRVLGVGAFQTRSRFAVVSGRTRGGGAAGGVCTGHLHSISIEFSGSGRSRRDLGLP